MFPNPADGSCADRAHGSTGSARRRRERRLRSWLWHERMTVAAELSAALHHSRDGERVPYVGLRAQQTGQHSSRGGGGPRSVRRPTGTEATSSGSGRHLCLRWPGRSRQSRSVTWLPRCLFWVLHRWPVPLPKPSMKAPSPSFWLAALRG